MTLDMTSSPRNDAVALVYVFNGLIHWSIRKLRAKNYETAFKFVKVMRRNTVPIIVHSWELQTTVISTIIVLFPLKHDRHHHQFVEFLTFFNWFQLTRRKLWFAVSSRTWVKGHPYRSCTEIRTTTRISLEMTRLNTNFRYTRPGSLLVITISFIPYRLTTPVIESTTAITSMNGSSMACLFMIMTRFPTSTVTYQTLTRWNITH